MRVCTLPMLDLLFEYFWTSLCAHCIVRQVRFFNCTYSLATNEYDNDVRTSSPITWGCSHHTLIRLTKRS